MEVKEIITEVERFKIIEEKFKKPYKNMVVNLYINNKNYVYIYKNNIWKSIDRDLEIIKKGYYLKPEEESIDYLNLNLGVTIKRLKSGKILVKKDGQKYKFKPLIESNNILKNLQKFSISFKSFCTHFWFENKKKTKKMYKAAQKEFEAMERLFTEEELNLLRELFPYMHWEDNYRQKIT